MGLVLQDETDYADLAVLASVLAGPVVMKLWSAVLFIVGTIDYIVETEALSPAYKGVAFLPVLLGIGVALLAMRAGELLDRKIHQKVSHRETTMVRCANSATVVSETVTGGRRSIGMATRVQWTTYR